MAISQVYWNRIEPRSKTDSTDSAKVVLQGMAAQIRDPLWLLTRQWQMGEFQGEDAGSPAFVKLQSKEITMSSVQCGTTTVPLSSDYPLEKAVQKERFSADLSVRLELGCVFRDAAISQLSGNQGAIDVFLSAVADSFSLDKKEFSTDPSPEAARLLSVLPEKPLDGVRVYRCAANASGAVNPALLQEPLLRIFNGFSDAALKAAVWGALTTLKSWVDENFDENAFDKALPADSSAWKSDRCEYEASALASDPKGSRVSLAITGEFENTLDWYSFDATELSMWAADVATKCLVPMHVRFNGMPNARWWDFESSSMNLPGTDLETGDLARSLLFDFMLLHSNDWFVAPYEQKAGSVSQIIGLDVKDVFGASAPVKRADAGLEAVSEDQRWTMFSIAATKSQNAPSGIFVLPSPPLGMVLGEDVEDVSFFRDETANLAWAIENKVEDGLGRPWSAHERAVASSNMKPSGSGAAKYRLQSAVQKNWIPFVPVKNQKGGHSLLRSVLSENPQGRILNPGAIEYLIPEETIPVTGMRLTRTPILARMPNGRTHLWFGRRKRIGVAQTSSGLKFDVIERP